MIKGNLCAIVIGAENLPQFNCRYFELYWLTMWVAVNYSATKTQDLILLSSVCTCIYFDTRGSFSARNAMYPSYLFLAVIIYSGIQHSDLVNSSPIQLGHLSIREWRMAFNFFKIVHINM